MIWRIAGIALGSTLPFLESMPEQWATRAQFGLLGLLIAVVVLTARPPQRVRAQGTWAFVAAFTLCAGLSASAFAVNPSSHWTTAGQLLIWTTVGPYAAMRLIQVPVFVRSAVTCFVLAQSASAAVALVQASGGTVLGASATLGRSPGLAGHFNILAFLSAIAFIVLISQVGPSGTVRPLMLAAVNLGGILASGSLSALTALGVGLVVYSLARRIRSRSILGGAVGLWLAYRATVEATERFPAFRGPFERYLQVSGQTSADSTLDIRQRTMEFAWQAIQVLPWGGGVGLDDASGVTFDGVTLTHNVLLRAWYQGGIFLALAFGALFLLTAGVALRNMKQGQGAGGAGVLAITWIFAMTAATFQQPYFWVPLMMGLAWATLGGAVALGGSDDSAVEAPAAVVVAPTTA